MRPITDSRGTYGLSACGFEPRPSAALISLATSIANTNGSLGDAIGPRCRAGRSPAGSRQVQSWDSHTQKMRSCVLNLGRFFCSLRIASCCRRARFSTASSTWLRNRARRKTKIICIGPMPSSQTLSYVSVKKHEHSCGRGSAKRRCPRKCLKPRFPTRIGFLGGTGAIPSGIVR